MLGRRTPGATPRRGAASQALTWRDPSKHRILIRALVAGSPEDRVLQAWIRNGETLGIGAIGWTEFLCGPLEESHLELAARVITSEDPLPRIALWWPHNCSTNPDVDGDLSSIACSPPRLCKRVLLWQLPTRPTSADSKLPDLPSRLSTSKN